MKLRAIKKSDIQACATLFSEVFSSEPWGESWSEDLAIDRLSHFYESKGFMGVLAESDGILGFALGNTEPFYFGPMFYLREMCTLPKLQNQGIGNKIINNLEKELISSNVHSIYLTTERDIPAASFYQNSGFRYSKEMGFYAKRINS